MAALALIAALLIVAGARGGTSAGAGPGDIGAFAGLIESRPDLLGLYGPRGFAPVWGADPEGSWRTAQLLVALAGAAAHGLDLLRHDPDAVRMALRGRAAEREIALTDAFVRYATEMRAGRVEPHLLDADWDIPRDRFDALAALGATLESRESFRTLLAELPPPANTRLRDALRRLRTAPDCGRLASDPVGTGASS